jgi:Double zinc ribbon
MQPAIFGIENDGLNLAVNLFALSLVAVWLALAAWTYLDARRRIEDPVLVGCATVAGFIPFIGPLVYSILRPPDFLEDARERDLETRAAELRVRQLSELACPNCQYPVEKTYLRCPNCQRRLKDPCQNCGKPVDPRWAVCPYCEMVLQGRKAAPSRGARRAPTREARTPAKAPRGSEARGDRSPQPAEGSGDREPARRPVQPRRQKA